VLTDGVVVAYALWTVAANLVVIAGGNARTLGFAGALVLAVLAALGVLVHRRVPWAEAFLADAAADPVLTAQRPGWASVVRGVALPLLTLLLWLITRNPWLAWSGLLLSTLVLYLRAHTAQSVADSEPVPAMSHARAERVVLYLLAACCALFTLVAVRPRADDTLYLNLAVSVVDAPGQALLSVLNLHGPAPTGTEPQHVFAPYRVHSFELLGGLISHLTGLEPAAVIHFWFATLLGWFTPFAVARLLRLLAPRYLLLGVLVVVSFYFIDGSASRGYANHALVRLFNGKAALLTIGVPLVCAYGLRYGARPSAWRLVMLACSQVASVGLSSTGIWLAPVLAMVSVAAGTPARRLLPARLGASVLSSAYVLGLGLWVLGQLKIGLVESPEVDSVAATAASLATSGMSPRFAALAEAFPVVLGPPHTAVALLGAVLLAALVSPTALGVRLFSALALLLAAVFGNPFLAKWVEHYVTGETAYQRVFWLLPVPVAVALCCIWLFGILAERTKPLIAVALTALALGGYYGLAIDHLVISVANSGRLRFPPVLKLPPHARVVAQTVCKLVPKGKCVLAPQAVSLQLPILPNCGYPLLTDERWLNASAQELLNRSALVRFVDKPGDIPPNQAGWFLDALAGYRVAAVVLGKDASTSPRTKSLVRIADFEHAAVAESEQIFVRTRAARREEYSRVVGRLCGLGGADVTVLAPFGVSNLLDERGCAKAEVSLGTYRKLTGAAADQLLNLERFTYMAGDLPGDRVPWLRGVLQSHAITVVVLGRSAMVNLRFRLLLGQIGFRKVAVEDGYTFLRRALPSPGQ
jgi:hypothetical protein